ncbi:MAG: hypothetical protein ACR2M2_10780, partial [Gaiellaceae bacterium]
MRVTIIGAGHGPAHVPPVRLDTVARGIDDERLADERRDDPTPAGCVVLRDEIEEPRDLVVGREIVAGDGEL